MVSDALAKTDKEKTLILSIGSNKKELKRVEKSKKVKMEYKRRFMAREAMLSPSCTSSPAKCPARDLRIDMIHSTGDL